MKVYNVRVQLWGLLRILSIHERTISLGPGDLILLYTDGLTEAFSPEGEMYGEEQLQEVLKAAEPSQAREVLNALEASVKQFMGPLPAADDLTMLALKRTAA